MSTEIDLDNARKVIAAEKCRYDRDDPESRWCANHGYHWPRGANECKARPEVADVAAELMEIIEQVRRLANKATSSRRGPEDDWDAGYLVAMRDVRRALDGGDDA